MEAVRLFWVLRETDARAELDKGVCVSTRCGKSCAHRRSRKKSHSGVPVLWKPVTNCAMPSTASSDSRNASRQCR